MNTDLPTDSSTSKQRSGPLSYKAYLAIGILLAIGLAALFLVKKGIIRDIPEPIKEKFVSKELYINRTIGFSFEYPSSWIVSTKVLQPGESVEKDGYKVLANDGEKEVVTASHPSGWNLIVEAQKEFTKDFCGGFGLSSWKHGFPYSYTPLKVLEREAVRPSVENGDIPYTPTVTKEPYPVVILFKRQAGELLNIGSMLNFPYAVKYCMEDASGSAQLKMVYVSKEVTDKMITDRKIKGDILKELDTMVSSIKLEK